MKIVEFADEEFEYLKSIVMIQESIFNAFINHVPLHSYEARQAAIENENIITGIISALNSTRDV